MQSVGNNYAVVEVTPTVSSGVAYTAGDQVGGIQTLSNAAIEEGRVTMLLSVSIVDLAATPQNAALNIFFFDQLPTVASSDNAELDIVIAQMSAKAVGQVAIAAADYSAVKDASVATKTISLPMRSRTYNGYLYAVVKTTGTPTYDSTTCLVFKYVFAKGF